MLGVAPDPLATQFIDEVATGEAVRLIAKRPGAGTAAEYREKLKEAQDAHHLPDQDAVLFLEVQPGDASEFSELLDVHGVNIGGFRVLRGTSPAVPNAIAALLLHVRDRTGKVPHVYFGWTEGNPIAYLMRFLAFGEGDAAPVAREVLRPAEADPPDGRGCTLAEQASTGSPPSGGPGWSG